MTKKLIVNLKDINQEWLDKLKEQHGNATLEIIVNSTHDSEVFEEALFWRIIGKRLVKIACIINSSAQK